MGWTTVIVTVAESPRCQWTRQNDQREPRANLWWCEHLENFRARGWSGARPDAASCTDEPDDVVEIEHRSTWGFGRV